MSKIRSSSYPRSMTTKVVKEDEKIKNRIDASSKVHCIVLKDRIKPKTSTGKTEVEPEPHLENCTAKDKQILAMKSY